MTFSRTGRLLVVGALLVATSGCGGAPTGGSGTEPSLNTTTTSVAASSRPSGPGLPLGEAPVGPIRIADGVTLTPGPSGQLPVSVRWVRETAAAEALAVDGGNLLVADETAVALRLSDGTDVWRTGDPSGHGLEADGSVLIGLDRRNHVRMWSPFNYDLAVDRASGRLVSLRAAGGGEPPAGIRPFASPAPRYRLGPDPRRTVAMDRRGNVAFEISVREPWFDTVGPVAVPGGMALVTSSGHLVVLDYR